MAAPKESKRNPTSQPQAPVHTGGLFLICGYSVLLQTSPARPPHGLHDGELPSSHSTTQWGVIAHPTVILVRILEEGETMFQEHSDFLKFAPATLKQKAAGKGVRSSHRGSGPGVVQ